MNGEAGDEETRFASLAGGFRTEFVPGNRVQLLVGGADFFPALIAAIDAARTDIMLETYIFNDDVSGQAVLAALRRAAQRGVAVAAVVDGFGSGEYGRQLARDLPGSGIDFRIFRPERWWQTLSGSSRRMLRRLHRKLVTIDGQTAFVGGINVLDDMVDPVAGPLEAPRFDFAVQLQGPIVQPLTLTMKRMLWRVHFASLGTSPGTYPRRKSVATPRAFSSNEAGLSVAFVPRDNTRFRSSIERAYIEALDAARSSVLIANAYFLPGRKLRRALLGAAQRGVVVQLLLQGKVEYLLQHHATQALYPQLLAAGVQVFEYTDSFLHAKVAVIDQDWATVGSSNIDPFSLLLALEANVIVRDAHFAEQLRSHLHMAMQSGARRVTESDLVQLSFWARLVNWLSVAAVRLGIAIAGSRSRY
jgi:cardiolipin synthase